MPEGILWLFVIGAGAAVGSFLNVCIHRLPRRLSIVRPRSACPSCGRPIGWHDNIPVVSWLALGRRCRHCRAPISWQYPLVEASTAGLFALLFAREGPTPAFLLHALLSAALVALIVIDARHQILPNAITLPGIVVGLLSSALRVPGAAPVRDALSGCVLGYAIPWSINMSYRLWQAGRGVPIESREDGIGQGDFKLLAMIGAFLGWRLCLFTLFAGAVSGAAYGSALVLFRGSTWKSRLPFGVFLGAAALVSLFVGNRWIEWYVGLAGLDR